MLVKKQTVDLLPDAENNLAKLQVRGRGVLESGGSGVRLHGYDKNYNCDYYA